MTISDLVPIQFWPVTGETFNEKVNAGVQPFCFLQKFNCDDVVNLQVNSTDPVLLTLEDSNGNVLESIDFETAVNNYWSLVFSFSDYSLCDQSIRARISKRTLPAWSFGASAGDNNWSTVAYGAGLFVTVSNTGANRVMTSPDGITWTARSAAAVKSWAAVCYGHGLFVAVGAGAGNLVMTSPDGINWTSQTTPANNIWVSVVCGKYLGSDLFVAVASSGVGNRVMTSPDGINWTIQASAADQHWTGVTYGNNKFVAVSSDGTKRVMTSTDGVAWTLQTTPATARAWSDVTFGNNLFVSVSYGAVADSVMTSPDGITWTLIVTPDTTGWTKIAYGHGFFIAVSDNGTSNILVSKDGGATWVVVAGAGNRQWYGIAIANGIAVAVAYSGSGDRAMATVIVNTEQFKSDLLDVATDHINTQLIQYSNKATYAGLSFSSDQIFGFRVNAKFFEERFPTESESEGQSDGEVVSLSSTVKSQRNLEIDAVPFYMHRKIIYALNCNTIYIDGEYWSREENYALSKLNDMFALFIGKVFLTLKNNSFLTNVFGDSTTV